MVFTRRVMMNVNLRQRWKMASQALICERKALPRPCPSAAPFTNPAMSTTFKNAGTLLNTNKVLQPRWIVLTSYSSWKRGLPYILLLDISGVWKKLSSCFWVASKKLKTIITIQKHIFNSNIIQLRTSPTNLHK